VVAIVAPAPAVAAGSDHARIVELPSAVGHDSILAATAPVAKGPRGGRSELPPNRRDRTFAERKEARAFEDALWIPQKEPGLPAPPLIAPTPGLNFDGLDSSVSGAGGVPDTNGDVGPNHYVQIVNKLWKVFDKNGLSLGGPFTENVLWSNQPTSDPCRDEDRGDPVVLYDQLADRWLLSYFAFAEDANQNELPPFYQCLAVSKTGDPLGFWATYSFDITALTNNGTSTTGFPDYPKFGVWPDGYYMSANLFPDTPVCVGGTSPAGTPCTVDSNCAGGGKCDTQDGLGIAFERDKILNGQSARMRGFVDTVLAGNMLPADYDGPPASAPAVGTPNPFVGPHPTQLLLRIRQFDSNWSGASATLSNPLSLSIADYDPTVCSDAKAQCVPQPGTSVKLDPLDHDQYMYRAAYRRFGDHESLVVAETVNVDFPGSTSGRAGIHWYELRGVTGSSPSVFQEGTFAPADTIYRWLPSAAMDKAGNLAVGYNVSNGTSVFPGLRYAGRTASATLGTFNVDETTLVSGGGSKTVANSDGRARWGDYASLTVDPVDDCTFWFTGEYLSTDVGASDWRTRIGSFRLPGCLTASTTTSSTTSSTTTSSTTTTRPTTTTQPSTTTTSTTSTTTSTSSTTPPSSNLRVNDCKAAPGGIARCEVDLTLQTGTEVATLQFNATVVPSPPAPALLGPVGFTQDPSLPAPNINQAEGSSTVLVGWFSPPISPHLTGARAIGSLSVPVPASAQAGQSYRLRIVAPSATSDGSTDVPLAAGADGTLSVGRKFLVCDVSPSGVDQDGDGDTFDAGEFGNGVINNADIVAIFRAALLPDQRPPTDSDLFSAMDAAPEDAPPACGGNGGLVNSDVVLCFRRSLLPLSQYERTRGGGLCTATLAGSVPRAAEPVPLAAAPAEVGAQAVTLGRPAGRVVARRGSRAGAGGIVTLPVGFRPAAGARVATLQFAATVSAEGTVPAPADGLQFEPAPRYPAPDLAIVEGSRLLLGWLRPLPVTARRDVRLGRLRVRLPETAVRGDRYRVSFGPASGTAPGGEELRLDGGSVRLKAARRE